LQEVVEIVRMVESAMLIAKEGASDIESAAPKIYVQIPFSRLVKGVADISHESGEL
jgi:hypothetical protein